MATRLAVGEQDSDGLGNGAGPNSYTVWTATDSDDWVTIVSSLYRGDTNPGSFAGILSSGELKVWGYNANYRLGLNDTTARNTPTQLLASGAAQVAIGTASGYVVKTDGTLWVWGYNASGQLGLGDTTTRQVPTQVGAGTTWSHVFASDTFALARKTDGTLWAAGTNAGGALGLGGTTTATTWTQIGSATDWSALVSCSPTHALAVKTNGDLYGWGDNSDNAYGSGSTSTTPTVLDSSNDTIAVSASSSCSIVIRSGGAAYGTGYNSTGRLGISTSGSTTTTWTAVSGVTTAASVFMGATVSGIIMADDTLMVAGRRDGYFELGMASVGSANVETFTTHPTLSGTISGFTSTGNVSHVLTTYSALVEDIEEGIVGSGVMQVFDDKTVTETVAGAVAVIAGTSAFLTDSSDANDEINSDLFTLYVDALVASTAITSTSNTTAALVDSALFRDVVQAALDQIVAETANGMDVPSLGLMSLLVDIADAVGVQVPTYTGVQVVAEIVAAIEYWNSVSGEDVTESSNALDTYANRVDVLVALLEQHFIDDVDEVVVHVMQAVTDTADGATAITSEGSIINALLDDTVLATIRLNIGGETFTGWVLNTDSLAPSEYQFADKQFNSACKHGSKYLMAAEDGIYQFTDDTSVESVMTYIKTGKTDFGSDLKKRVVNSYIVYSASGNMVLKVTTSEYGQLQTRNYRMVPPSNSETTDVRRFDIGRGIKSRYWQFELLGDGVDCDIDEIGMLPVVLSRRI